MRTEWRSIFSRQASQSVRLFLSASVSLCALFRLSVKICVICGLLLISSGSVHALVVASYNVENYLSTGRMVEGVYRRDYPKPEAEKAALRANILAIKPDILALQEMGDLPYLEELQRDLKRDGVDYPYIYLGVGKDRIRHTAVLSKIKPVAVKKHLDLDFKYFDARAVPQRGLLELKFGAMGEIPAFSLYVVHLKSKRTIREDDFESMQLREKEARVIRDRVLESHGEDDDAAYLIVGDFNDLRNSAPVQRFLQVNGRETGALIPMKDRDGYYWTYYWDRAHLYSRVDYIFASRAMMAVWSGDAGVYGNSDGSDHRLIWASFE